jgi:GntR family transcriptional regulator, transcriptional repressor for pyruvate dehydrogenase complex
MTEQPPPESMFADRGTLSAKVAEAIYQRIRQQRLASGAIIGTEAELAEQFGVSRTVIREAVGSLRGLGIVSSRQGRGLCVARGDVIDTMAKAFAPLVTDERNWAEICHLRYVLEIGSLPLVIEKATEEGVCEFRDLAAEMLKLVSENLASQQAICRAVSQREVRFHQLLLTTAGSQLTTRFHRLLFEYFYKAYSKGPFAPVTTVARMQQHVDLTDAIEAQDLSRAIGILGQHIDLNLLPLDDESS